MVIHRAYHCLETLSWHHTELCEVHCANANNFFAAYQTQSVYIRAPCSILLLVEAGVWYFKVGASAEAGFAYVLIKRKLPCADFLAVSLPLDTYINIPVDFHVGREDLKLDIHPLFAIVPV